MARYELRVSSQVERDLREIKFYMKNLGMYESTIEGFFSNVYKTLELIAITPMIGTSLSTKVTVSTNIRFFVVKGYLIFYEISGREVNVYRIISERKDYIRILKLGE